MATLSEARGERPEGKLRARRCALRRRPDNAAAGAVDIHPVGVAKRRQTGRAGGERQRNRRRAVELGLVALHLQCDRAALRHGHIGLRDQPHLQEVAARRADLLVDAGEDGGRVCARDSKLAGISKRMPARHRHDHVGRACAGRERARRRLANDVALADLDF